jgi:hypothetical protein
MPTVCPQTVIDAAEKLIKEARARGELQAAIRDSLRLAMIIAYRPIKRAQLYNDCGKLHQTLALKAAGHVRREQYLHAARCYLRAAVVFEGHGKREDKPPYQVRRIASLCMAIVADTTIHQSELLTLLKEIDAYRNEAHARYLHAFERRFDAIAKGIALVLETNALYGDAWSSAHVRINRFAECELLLACGCKEEARLLANANDVGLIAFNATDRV